MKQRLRTKSLGRLRLHYLTLGMQLWIRAQVPQLSIGSLIFCSRSVSGTLSCALLITSMLRCLCSDQIWPSIAMLSLPWRVSTMREFLDPSLKGSTALRVCLRLGPMITLPSAFLRAVTVMGMLGVAQSVFQLASHYLLIKKFVKHFCEFSRWRDHVSILPADQGTRPRLVCHTLYYFSISVMFLVSWISLAKLFSHLICSQLASWLSPHPSLLRQFLQ